MIDTLKKVDDKSIREIIEEQKVRKTKEFFVLFPLGSQFDHLIKQHLDKLGVFCLVADSVTIKKKEVKKLLKYGLKGIILSGGPASAHTNPPPFDGGIFDIGIPVLGICLGFQMWAYHIGEEVQPAKIREFGIHKLRTKTFSSLFSDLPEMFNVLQSHGDHIASYTHITVTAQTDNAIAAGEHRHLYGVQFHPEVHDSEYGEQIFSNFCFHICGAKDIFPAADVGKKKILELRKKIAGKKVLLGLSGGSDSSVVAYLLKEAAEDNNAEIHAIYIEGIDRPDDKVFLLKYFGDVPWLKLHIVDATDEFLEGLKGITKPKEKRLAMRGVYKPVIEKLAAEIGADFIAQGTLYTDLSESGFGYDTGSEKAVIKLHHNVNLKFSLPEITPLDDCVKDGARNIGRSIGVPEELLVRHPFPGPGMLVRIEGEITKDKLRIARIIDAIWIEELRKWDLYHTVWQAGVRLLNSETTCTKGDGATSGLLVITWAVWSVNGFTAQAAELPYDFLKHVDIRIGNEVPEIGGTSYRISGKPYSTIEYE